MRKITWIYVALFLLIFVTGCSQQGLSEEEIKQKILEANSNINSFHLDTNGKIDMSMIFFGQNIDLAYDFVANEKVNKINKKLYAMIDMKLNARSTNSGKDISIGGQNVQVKDLALNSNQQVNMEAYVINDMLYTKTNGEWMKSRLRGDIWKNNDQFSKTFEMYKTGNIEFLGEEKIDGVNYYKVKITPVNYTLESSYGQLDSTVEEFSSTVWINKKTFVIEKIRSTLKIVSNDPKPQQGESTVTLFGGLKVAYDFDVRLSNVNGNVNVNLPPEALTAKEGKDESIDTLVIL